MTYRDDMTPEELEIFMAGIEVLDQAYADCGGEPFDENDLEDWTDKEYRMLRP